MKNPPVIHLVLSLILINSLGTILAQAPSNGTVKSYQKISDTEGNFAATLDNSDTFGGSVAAIGDLNNDSINDIVIGSSTQRSNYSRYHAPLTNASVTRN